jgi:hypothetical protein
MLKLKKGGHMKKFAFVMLSCLMFSSLSATWTMVNDMNSKRVGFGTAVLTDGRVMVVTSFENWTHEIFDPATGIWTQGTMPNMGGIAWHPQTILLPDGTVLYVTPDYGDILLYDPVFSVWNNPSLSLGPCWDRADATVLRNGQVLLAGWDPIDPFTYCSLYDGGSVNSTGELNVEHSFRAVEALLHTGEVLIVGGFSNRKGAEVYNPATESWRVVSNASYDRFGGTGIKLPPPWNKILFIGPFAPITETFDIVSGNWEDAGTLNNAKRGVPTTVMLPMGKPMVIGGELNKTCEIYDPAAKTWTYTDSLSCPRAHYSSCILHTGKILAIGGFSLSPSDTIKTVEIFDTTESVWSNKPTLVAERAAHTTTPLPIISTANCSTNILITGGENSGGFLKSCELYNYLEEEVELTGPLSVARARHGANLLPDSKVLVCGGENSGGALSSCELFTASTGAWAGTGDMGTARFNHTSTLLSDGKVFITGGEDGSTILSSCETYSAGTWTSAKPMTTERTGHSCALLLDGKVLVIGGKTNGVVTGTCEIYDPGLDTWSGTGALTVARYLHTTVVLESGKVLAIAGDAGGGSPIPFCEIYDPGAGTWSQAPSLNQERYSHNSMVIYSGLVLTLGGHDGSNYLSSCEIYDPCIPIAVAPNWKRTVPLNTARGIHSSCNTPELRPFVVTIGGKTSGTGFSNSIEEYDIGLGYQPEWQSTITNCQAISHVSDSMYMQGTLFRGVSEADGGNHCHIVSSDHPIASLLRIGGGNWQSNGGGCRLVMPRSSAWSDTHTCIRPSNPAAGYYMLCTIVNGIPCKWYNECAGVEEGTDRLQAPGSRVRVYPNPATSSTVLHFNVGPSDHGLLTITVYDLSGRLVRRTTHDTDQVTIKGLKPGMYFYNIDREGVKSSGKFVVVK